MPTNTNPLDNLSNEDLSRMYPDLYKKLKPYIDDTANKVRNRELDQNMIQSIIDDILTRSGVSDEMYEPDQSMETFDTIAVQRPMNFGNMFNRNQRNQYQHQDYNRRRTYPIYPRYPVYPVYPINYGLSPQELARLLLLRQLGGYNPYYPNY